MRKHSISQPDAQNRRVADAPDHSLDLRTTYDHDFPVVATVYRYSDGTMEMGYSSNNSHKAKHPSLSASASSDNSGRTTVRAKSFVRRLVLTMGGKALLTLTYRENQTDYNQAKKHFQDFARRARRHFGTFRYVAVPETQKRGAWHFHVVLDRYYRANDIRAIWEHGNIDLQKVRSAKSAARYLTKYLSKTFDGEWPANEPRYLRSRNIKLNTEKHTFENTHQALDHFHKMTEGIHEYHWEKDGNGFITT